MLGAKTGAGAGAEVEEGAGTGALSGKGRRALRAVAQRLKSQSELATVTCSTSTGPIPIPAPDSEGSSGKGLSGASVELSAGFVDNLQAVLVSRGLVQVRFSQAGKRKECQALGAELVERLGSGTELVQVVGHTALLYRPSQSGEGGEVERLLRLELAKN